MTKNMKKAIIERINDSLSMIIESSSVDECTSAYVRAIDAVAQLYLAIMKEHTEK